METLERIAAEVYHEVYPLLGTLESRRIMGSGFGGDKTRLIDAVAEETILGYLERNRLSCTFVGEECGVQRVGENSDFYLIADGVDGTINAMRGIGFASTSIAASMNDRLLSLEGAIVMNLFTGEVYEAEWGKGASYKGRKISPSRIAALEDAILSIDVSRAPEAVDKVVPIMKVVKSLRSLGSAALEICNVASGLTEAHVDVRGKLRTVDIAAAMLILRESGGVLLQPDGTELPDVRLTELDRFSVIAAANRGIYEEIVSLIR